MREDVISAVAADMYRVLADVVKRHEPLDKEEVAHALAVAISVCVAWDSMQAFLDNLAVCAAAKERVRAIEAGQEPDVH